MPERTGFISPAGLNTGLNGLEGAAWIHEQLAGRTADADHRAEPLRGADLDLSGRSGPYAWFPVLPFRLPEGSSPQSGEGTLAQQLSTGVAKALCSEELLLH